MRKERRKVTDHDIVNRVILCIGVPIGLLSTSAGASLLFVVVYSVTNRDKVDPSILSLLIAAVSNPLSAGLGYLAGLTQSTQRDAPHPMLGTALEPMVTESKITNAPSEAVPTTDTPTPEPAPLTTQTDEGEMTPEEGD